MGESFQLIGGPGDGSYAEPDESNPWVLKWTDLAGKVHDYLLDPAHAGRRCYRWTGRKRRVHTKRVGPFVFWRIK